MTPRKFKIFHSKVLMEKEVSAMDVEVLST
jgi:hypothetical protein